MNRGILKWKTLLLVFIVSLFIFYPLLPYIIPSKRTSNIPLEEEVFYPNNFRIVSTTGLLYTLDFIKKPSCQKVFNDWLAIARSNNQYDTPPRDIPTALKEQYLLNNHVALKMIYSDTHPKKEDSVWSMIPQWMELPENDLYKISAYGLRGKAVYHAFKHYPIHNKVGFVVGSERPWVEVYALLNGAKEVTTVEYQKLVIEGTNKVRYIHPVAFAEQWKENQGAFDFAASFSSIEHSGLGRYGDPLDPIGDLREVWKISCLLKQGGLLFLGLPRGDEVLVFNLHRIYGPIRLAMIMTGFEWLATFRRDTPHPINFTWNDFKGYHQDLFVLRKI
ncbi:hypothetical protein Q1695_008783 [Nippostrongylus brasiliensis]|nr:hypothetical protein Q1695_008783 [Nippostrongylus brasiliensis]